MALDLTFLPASYQTTSLNRAILETLAYSDIFDYPLHLNELHRYLTVPATLDELKIALSTRDSRIEFQDDYYFLAGRKELVAIRQERERTSGSVFRRALRYGRLLGRLPFIRMVGLTGSLAVRNSDEHADLDYMLVAAHGRVWLARAFALLLGRLTALFGNTLCPNLIVSEQSLEWFQPDLYSARELCQMIPVSGREIYQRLRKLNGWTMEYLPNATDMPENDDGIADELEWAFPVELVLRNPLGDRLEAWEMKRKVTRFTHQAGYGDETTFNADICQGNFHHHGAWTRAQFQKRLIGLGLEENP